MDCKITHVRKAIREDGQQHISEVGNIINSSVNWIWTSEEVIAGINAGTNTFYVLEAGKRSDVRVDISDNGNLPFLRINAEGQWNDNLFSLPEC
jgi:hypothetical protein